MARIHRASDEEPAWRCVVAGHKQLRNVRGTMTNKEIERAWQRFMQAEFNGAPLWVHVADSGIDARGMQEAFFGSLSGDDTALERLKTYLNAVADDDVGSSAWQDLRN
jgi:hypothetical protein